jgi:hypothetical protein
MFLFPKSINRSRTWLCAPVQKALARKPMASCLAFFSKKEMTSRYSDASKVFKLRRALAQNQHVTPEFE